MSSSFIRRFLNYSKILFAEESKSNITSIQLAFRFGILTTVLAGHGIYAYSTEEKDAILVTKKYKMNRNGFTDFMIIDDKGRHFNVNNSLWYWKWDSIEDWYSIKEEQKLNTLTYGWRLPILGMFPNIVSSQYNKSNKNDNTKIINMIINTSLEEELADGKFC
jgi:hypothetical protein